MAPDRPLNERVAGIEPLVALLLTEVSELQVFKTDMITQITELKSELKFLTWRVAFITGTVLLVGNKFLDWGLGKIIH